jgi:hypothetical protein
MKFVQFEGGAKSEKRKKQKAKSEKVRNMRNQNPLFW